jgi:hypothetical protein
MVIRYVDDPAVTKNTGSVTKNVDNVTEIPRGVGRPRKDVVMSAAERARAYRERKRERKNDI